MSTSYWVWSNKHGGWRMAHQAGYTQQLHEAGRFVEHVALQLVAAGNKAMSRVEYPNLVMVEVNDTFLTPQAREIMETYREPGAQPALDDAYFSAQDRALRGEAPVHHQRKPML